ncbi:hypothetical protein ANOM_009586 [Aspergillus nomiae NRRL 13137]|uniref:Uncharacterized protein n=1 Tax=Aspergillus nomiae NRRL (strain ATCC 15546 / NRRL 13137 / CBS 260.88 / M93) TaxID=1509407 RepID=A0A0L1IU49_ASPN3|nr:uncharacterized protein ANOM_009586 [Aspergillus nomiae NRRL 13137]KNG83017.1 hypothetical protein ANOM_009586 [Aspergillus nomiae NRRL 13137]
MDLPIGKPPRMDPGMTPGEIPSDDDMGFNDPQNLIWINMVGRDISERFRDRIEEFKHRLRLTHQFATIHAGIQVMQRKAEGTLPTDNSDSSRWKRSQYRARVLESYFQDGIYPWINPSHQETVSEKVNVEKRSFHSVLVNTMLIGISHVGLLSPPLEDIIKGVADTISKTEFTPKQQSFWGMLQVLEYDEMRDDLRVSIRNITYTLNQEMYKVIKGKDALSQINVECDLGRNDFKYNERTWKMLQPDVEQYIKDAGIDKIEDPPTVQL